MKTGCDFIGMLHIPVNTILSSPPAWREALGLPSARPEDWERMNEMEAIISAQPVRPWMESPSLAHSQDRIAELEEAAGELSFYNFLKDRLFREAELYMQHKADKVLMENIAAPYFLRGQQPICIFVVMSRLAKELKQEFEHGIFGMQILAHSDNWAMDIAVRNNFEFVRGESLLFSGLRPEGETPNHGNLAKLNMMRNELMSCCKMEGNGLVVYADLQKKHTVFQDGLSSLDFWLDNLLFLKLEGIVLTGVGTGQPTKTQDLQKARQAILHTAEKAKEIVQSDWQPKMLVGSGVTVDNIGICKKFASGVIVGTSLKKNGYWECALDEERLKEFAGKWHDGGN